MKKFYSLLLFFISVLLNVDVYAQEGYKDDLEFRKWRITLIPPLSTNGVDAINYSSRRSINIIGGYHGGLDGWEIGLLFNATRKYTRGLQIAGGVNYSSGDIIGLNFAGLMNGSKGSISGVQFSGISNYSKHSMKGIQGTLGINYSGNSSSGMQFAGVGNLSKQTIEGIHAAGIFNAAGEEISGIQVAGIFNVARKDVEGIQAASFFNLAGEKYIWYSSNFWSKYST